MNKAESSVVGLQVALGNVGPAQATYGAQVGIYNRSNRVYGFQIGLVNFNKTGIFAVAPLLNIGF